MLCMLFVERLRLFHCFRRHEGFLFSLRQCCMRVLGMWILGVRLADSSGSMRGLVTASGLTFVSFSFPSVFWHCDSIELLEWGIHLHSASLLWICILLTGALLFRKFSRWIKGFPHLSRMPGSPTGAIGQHYLNGAGEIPGISILCMPMASTNRLFISFWRASSVNPSLIQT